MVVVTPNSKDLQTPATNNTLDFRDAYKLKVIVHYFRSESYFILSWSGGN
jgi:hypothetical protein